MSRLIVTGEARGRLINLDDEGPLGPYVVEDVDFLAWYERWLDESMAGYAVGFFGERLPLGEADLIAALAADPSPARRLRAGMSLLQLPAVSDDARTALGRAMADDPDPTLRAELLDHLGWWTLDRRHQPEAFAKAADVVARHARSCAPPGLEALATLRRLTFHDILRELSSQDPERRRSAAYLLGHSFGQVSRDGVPESTLDGVTRRLLDDRDPLLRYHGVAAVGRFELAHLHPLLRELRESEQDPWVLHHIRWQLADESEPTYEPADSEVAKDWASFSVWDTDLTF
ncbi:hypothetical protein AB0B31_26350 [Catellatospora citrea]|uniref:hypothetical protein n=1 Tax=Catellatospora citrea TaxID=53366 RepID=UPI00340DB136